MPDVLTFDAATHRYTFGGRIVPSVTQILAGVGMYDFGHASRETLAAAAERGHIVHTYIEWHERGTLDEESVDPALAGYFRAYLAAKEAGELPAGSPSRIETMVYSDKYGYAGTLDQMWGTSWINDLKTCPPDPAHGLQKSAYWLAEHPDMADRPERLTATYLTAEGFFRVVEYPYEPLAWLAVLADYNWRRKNGKIKGS